jgi:citrate lyase beta subunit
LTSPEPPVPRLGDADLVAVDDLVAPADAAMAGGYPGDDGRRQPVHTVYVPADRVRADLVPVWGAAARAALDHHAESAPAFAAAVGADVEAVADVWRLLLAKLESEPIEDLRIDLEDGYGLRDDDEEDTHAVRAARSLLTAIADGVAPPYSGIRFKSLEAATRRRGLRTLDLVLGTLLDDGSLPSGWVVTLPKVTSVSQVHGMVEACRRLEAAYGLPERLLRFEIQVETPQAILGPDGTTTVARLVHASDDRCTGLHFGTYDYTAALGIGAAYQAMDHPAADHAKALMALAAAGTGVRLSDGSTNILPVGERSEVHAAWALHARLVRRSLERGYYQGWDLHPAQLPTRFLASYLFFRDGLSTVGARLKAYLGGVQSGVLDEPATAQALAGFVLRGVDCGAVTREEVRTLTGVDLDAIRPLARRA